jgi:hypothetical protein
MGRCNPNQTAGTVMPYGGYGRGMAFRRGRGGGFGAGRGFRRGFGMGYGWAGPAAASGSELDVLKNEADFMKKSLETINRRIAELETKPSE